MKPSTATSVGTPFAKNVACDRTIRASERRHPRHSTSITASIRFLNHARSTLETTGSDEVAQRPWRQAIEVLATGGSIGIAVVVARLFTTPGTTMQWVAFGLAAFMITIFHCILRQNIRQSWAAIVSQLMARQHRSRVFERFAHETNASWMGLREPLDLGDPMKPSREALAPR